MKFMLLICSEETAGPQPGTEEFGPYMQAFMDYDQMVKDDGVFVAGEALNPVATATTVTIKDGKTVHMDGPFAETKEVLGGFYILDCKDLDEALSYAAKIPTADHGVIEVRPVMVFD